MNGFRGFYFPVLNVFLVQQNFKNVKGLTPWVWKCYCVNVVCAGWNMCYRTDIYSKNILYDSLATKHWFAGCPSYTSMAGSQYSNYIAHHNLGWQTIWLIVQDLSKKKIKNSLVQLQRSDQIYYLLKTICFLSIYFFLI